MDASPAGFQGLILQMQFLKVGVPNTRYEPFHPQKEALGFSWVSSGLQVPAWDVGFMGMLCLSLSYPLPCGFPLICPIGGVALLVFRFFFFLSPKGNFPIRSCKFVLCIKGGDFGIFLHCHRNQNFLTNFLREVSNYYFLLLLRLLQSKRGASPL